MKIIIATIKNWNIKEAKRFKYLFSDNHDVTIIENKEDLTENKVNEIKPDYIFFPHWSWIIPQKIYENYNCIVFHMTDLPYGRGGSPLQNLIAEGHQSTKISAIKVVKELDAGPIYLKEELSLYGDAEEIYIRAAKKIFDKMIPVILENRIEPTKQIGTVTCFSRRKIEHGEIIDNMSIEEIFNQIRMLDAEGYPKAYMNFGKYRIEFSRASLKSGKIIADIELLERDENE